MNKWACLFANKTLERQVVAGFSREAVVCPLLVQNVPPELLPLKATQSRSSPINLYQLLVEGCFWGHYPSGLSLLDCLRPQTEDRGCTHAWEEPSVDPSALLPNSPVRSVVPWGKQGSGRWNDGPTARGRSRRKHGASRYGSGHICETRKDRHFMQCFPKCTVTSGEALLFWSMQFGKHINITFSVKCNFFLCFLSCDRKPLRIPGRTKIDELSVLYS